MQYGEGDVRVHLAPYHDRIWEVIARGYDEWVTVKRARTEMGIGPVLYPRTIANNVFDAVARHALAEFSEDSDVRVFQDAQTVKFCFGDIVLARFKKGDESHPGQNQPTQAVLDFVTLQRQLPGLPPSAAKVEFLYSANEVEEVLEKVIVAARDGDDLLWHYEIERRDASDVGIVPFPTPKVPEGEMDDDPLVFPIKRSNDASNKDGN